MERVSLRKEFEGIGKEEKFRIYRRLWNKAMCFEISTDYPLHFDIEISGHCNLKCNFCFQNGLIKQPLGNMNIELFKKIIEEGIAKGLCAIKLQVRGEAFLHPQVFDYIRFAKDVGILDIQITTNGTLINDENMHKIIYSGLDGIIFSCDDTHKNSFKRLNKAHYYSPVESIIKDFLKLRAKLKKRRPWVRIVTNTAKLDNNSLQQIRDSIINKFPEADVIAVNRIHDPRDNADAFNDLHLNYFMKPCPYTMQRLAIFWNGDVTTCAWDYNNRFQFGNIYEESIQDIWLSDKIEHIRKMHFKGKRRMIPICKHCQSSLVSISKNRVVDRMPRHFADHNH